MAALDFPDAPTVGQVFDRWQWDGTMWELIPVPGARIDGGFANIADHPQAAVGVVLNVTTPAPVAFATWMFVTATVSVGSSSQAVAAIVGSINTVPPNATGPPSSAGNSVAANNLLTVPLTFAWQIAANGPTGFNISAGWAAGSANIYTAATATWNRYRA